MCGRYNIIDDPSIHSLLRSLGLDFHLPARVNIAPTEAVPVIINAGSGQQIHEMRWWLTPSWAPEISTQYSMFNARAETLTTSKAFRGPFKHKRGIMPASSFIEWRKEGGIKQPYLIQPQQGAFAFAAIWDQWEKSDSYVESCALITTNASESMRWLHSRMPVMLMEEQFEQWLDPSSSQDSLLPLLQQGLPADLEAFPLSTAINNGRQKDESLLDAEGESRMIGKKHH